MKDTYHKKNVAKSQRESTWILRKNVFECANCGTHYDPSAGYSKVCRGCHATMVAPIAYKSVE